MLSITWSSSRMLSITCGVAPDDNPGPLHYPCWSTRSQLFGIPLFANELNKIRQTNLLHLARQWNVVFDEPSFLRELLTRGRPLL